MEGVLVDTVASLLWCAAWGGTNLVCRRWLYPTRATLSFRERQVAEHLTGLLHAIVSTGVALGVILPAEMRQDIIYSRSSVFEWGFPITLGYMLYDSVLIVQAVWVYFDEFTKGEQLLHKQYVAHHAFILAGGVYKILARPAAGDFAMSIFLLQEATNIPHDTRQVMLHGHMTEKPWLHVHENSPWHLILGVVFLILYVLCRLVSVVWLFWLYAAQKGVYFLQVLPMIPIKCLVGSSLILGMNLYWLSFIVAKVLRRIRSLTSVEAVKDHKKDQ